MSYYIGIDIGGTSVKAGLVNEKYEIVKKMSLPTYSQAGEDNGEKLANALNKLVRDLCAETGIPLGEVVSIGAGIPGSVDSQSGTIIYSNNIVMENVPLRELVLARLGRKIEMANDADAAALGECLAGAMKGCKYAMMITLGTGVGSGVIIDGKIYSGYHSRGGEFGHTVVEIGGVRCTCGRPGCLESYASATGLIRMTKEEMMSDPQSGMWELVGGDIGKVDGKTAFDAREKGDASAAKVVDTYIRYLACGVTNFINMLHPQKICFGGGISHSGEALLAPLRAEVYKEVYGGADRYTTELVQASLGNDAGIIGAAFLGTL